MSKLVKITLCLLLVTAVSGCVSKTTVEETPESTPPEQLEYTVSLSMHPSLGEYLVDSQGKTLYIYTKDITGSSTCDMVCQESWPVFFVEAITTAEGLNSEDFSTIVRADNSRQTTYHGWPLYYFIGDLQSGDTKGRGLNNVWFLAKPDYAALLMNVQEENFLVDPSGRALYYFTNDRNGTSTCLGDCVERWPIFYATSKLAPSIVDMNDFSEIVRVDGARQTTYKGWPLYYFSEDLKRGDTNGHNLNNVWFLVEANQTRPTSEAGAMMEETATTTEAVTTTTDEMIE